MGATKKMYEKMFEATEGLVLRDEYGNPEIGQWMHMGFFDGYNVYKKTKK